MSTALNQDVERVANLHGLALLKDETSAQAVKNDLTILFSLLIAFFMWLVFLPLRRCQCAFRVPVRSEHSDMLEPQSGLLLSKVLHE